MKDQPRPGSRDAKAAATRDRMLSAAREVFVARGYQATTMKVIADRAGVAVPTLYFTFTNKRTILKEVIDREVAGDRPFVPTLDQPWVAGALAASADEMLARLVQATAEIHERVVPVLEVVRSAAPSDPEIAGLWRTNIEQRTAVIRTFIGALAGTSQLRDGCNLAHATDATLHLLSPEGYHLLTVERGWDQPTWVDWATDALRRQLLPHT